MPLGDAETANNRGMSRLFKLFIIPERPFKHCLCGKSSPPREQRGAAQFCRWIPHCCTSRSAGLVFCDNAASYKPAYLRARAGVVIKDVMILSLMNGNYLLMLDRCLCPWLFGKKTLSIAQFRHACCNDVAFHSFSFRRHRKLSLSHPMSRGVTDNFYSLKNIWTYFKILKESFAYLCCTKIGTQFLQRCICTPWH